MTFSFLTVRNRYFGLRPDDFQAVDFQSLGVPAGEESAVRTATRAYFSKLAVAKKDTAYSRMGDWKLKIRTGHVVSPEAITQFHLRLASLGLDQSYSARQCIKWSAALRDIAEEIFNQKILLTIGCLFENGQPLLNVAFNDLFRWAVEGFAPGEAQAHANGLSLHAWWTLANGQIVDLTLYPSLAATRGLGNAYAHAVLVGYPGALGGFEYVPMAVGEAYVEALVDSTKLPLLAKGLTPWDMHSTPYLFSPVL